MKPPFDKWMPSNFGIWSTTMTIPIPALNPMSTGSEMKSARKPSRSSHASTRNAPTNTVNVAEAPSKDHLPERC